MDQPFLQSTLRDLQSMARSPRLWGTFAAVVLIFTVTGSYGTATMPAGIRLIYWLTIHAAAWSIAILFSVLADRLLAGWISSLFARMMTGSIIAALPIALALAGIDFIFLGFSSGISNLLWRALLTTPLCAIFCLLTYMTTRRPLEEPPAADTPKQTSTLLDRLKPGYRGTLLRLSVQDHYTEVVTSNGRELVLIRFSDALKEIDDTAGLRIHRSHWVADCHVESLRQQDGRLFVLTRDGTSLPVSRPYVATARGRFR